MVLWQSERFNESGLFSPLWKSDKELGQYCLPLETSLVPHKSQVQTVPTLSRATTGSVVDFEGIVHTGKINEIRFPNKRMVENLLSNTEALSTQTVTVTSGSSYILSFAGTGSVTLSGAATGTLTGTGSDRVEVTKSATTTSLTLTVLGSVLQAQLEKASGTQTEASEYVSAGVSVDTGEELVTNGNFSNGFTSWYPGSNALLSVLDNQLTVQLVDGDTFGNAFYSFNVISGKNYKFEANIVSSTSRVRAKIDLTALSNEPLLAFTSVGEHVGWFISPITGTVYVQLISLDINSNAVFSNISVKEEYYHGANVDGVKYFDTDRDGNKISDSMLKGYLNEPQGTNLFLNSEAAVTQTITVTSGSDYTIYFLEGTGSITLSGAGTGTVTSGEDNSVTITAGTTALVCTVSGDVNKVQVAKEKFPTSYIKTKATTVTRIADILTVDNSARNVLPNNFCMVGTWIPLGDGADYATTNIRLFGSQDSNGNAYEVTTIGGTDYAYTPGTGGGVFTIDTDDIVADTEHMFAFQLRQNGINVEAKIYLNGVEKLSTTVEQTLDHSNTSLEIASWAGSVFGCDVKDVKIYHKELSDSQLARITS